MPAHPRLSDDHRSCVIQALQSLRPAVIYLFGSFGTCSQHADSDIDIALLPAMATEPITCFHLANLLADQLGRPVDLVDLNEASTVLAKEVLRTGIPIDIANPQLQQQFEMRTLADYARLNEERQPILAS